MMVSSRTEKKELKGNEMKTIVLNASPRKTWNTAKLLKSAAKGVEDAGAQVTYIDLYDLNFTGCRSCMLCKRKGVQRCHCYWPDDLSCALSYDDYHCYFTGKVNVGMFVSMNATKPFYDRMYKDAFEGYAAELKMLNGTVELHPCYNTLQVADYSKFDMASFDETAKRYAHEHEFPKDLENVYQVGKHLSTPATH